MFVASSLVMFRIFNEVIFLAGPFKDYRNCSIITKPVVQTAGDEEETRINEVQHIG